MPAKKIGTLGSSAFDGMIGKKGKKPSQRGPDAEEVRELADELVESGIATRDPLRRTPEPFSARRFVS